jgi:hypothetical protein
MSKIINMSLKYSIETDNWSAAIGGVPSQKPEALYVTTLVTIPLFH